MDVGAKSSQNQEVRTAKPLVQSSGVDHVELVGQRSPIPKRHELLKRQLKKYFGSENSIPPALQDFIQAINDTYIQFEEDYSLLEKCLDFSSQELIQANTEMQNVLHNVEAQVVERTSELEKALASLQQEILERNAMEEALRHSEERFRTIFAGAAIGIALSTPDGLILEANPAKQNMLGYSDVELKRMHFSDYTHPEDRSKDVELYQELFDGKRNYYQTEKRYIRKDGQIVWGRLTVSIVQDGREGGPAFAVRMMEDINERKLAEESLKLRDKAIAASSSGIVLVDYNLPDAPMIYVNPAFERMTGYTAAESVGRNCRFLQGEDINQPGLQQLRAAIKAGQDCTVILRNYRKDGSLFWNELSISPIHDAKGAITHFVGIQTDITERRRAEVQLKEKVQREQLLNQLSNQIRHTLDLDTILETTVQAIRNLLAIDRCTFAWCWADEEYPFWEVVKEDKLTELNSSIGNYTGSQFGKLTDAVIQLELSRIDNVAILDDENLRQTLQSLSISSAVTIPIQAHSDAIGVLSCYTCDLKLWQESEIKLLEDTAGQLAIAIDQAELYEQSRISAANARSQAQKLEQTNQELQSQIYERERIEKALREQEKRLRKQNQALAKLTKAKTLYCNDFKEALDEITETAARIIDVERASIWLFNEDRSKLICLNLFERSIERHSEGFELVTSDFPSYFQALAEERSFMVYDAQNDPRTCEFTESYLRPLGITSMLEASIWLGGEMVGVICSEHVGSCRQWALEEENFANSLADFVSLVMEVQDRKRAEAALRTSEAELKQKAQELEQALVDLQRTQSQLIQTEKMSSLGQLVAGVAHEINNPVNFIYGNIGHASRYMEDLIDLLKLYQTHFPEANLEIQEQSEAIDIDFLLRDLPKMLTSMKIGAERIRQIVLSLRNFSRLDEAEMKPVDIHEGIDSTLLILQHRFKPKEGTTVVSVVKNYAELPKVECYAGQLNQVFMNILSNAIDTLEETPISNPQITITTEVTDFQQVRIKIADNGAGMSEIVRQKLFDPFFTTKPVGQGTGLGLSISYQIVVEKHKGRLECVSAPSQGAEFIIEIPIKHKQGDI